MNINKKISLCYFLLFLANSSFAQNVDTIQSKALKEATVIASTQTETATKASFLPTLQQKKHSTNGVELLNLMQLPNIEVTLNPLSIHTKSGGNISFCIDGKEVTLDELKTLRTERIKKVEYIKNPTGKFIGKAGLLNIITEELKVGGNVYLQAMQEVTYDKKDYHLFTDFVKNNNKLSLSLLHKGSKTHSYVNGEDKYTFEDKSVLKRTFENKDALQKQTDNGIRLKYANYGKNSFFSTQVTALFENKPDDNYTNLINYTEKEILKTQKRLETSTTNITPAIKVEYELDLPKGQNFSLTAEGSFGKNSYKQHYQEGEKPILDTKADENNYTYSTKALYSKALNKGFSYTAMLVHSYKNYTDTYQGSSKGVQKLSTIENIASLQLSKATENYFYYLSLGLSQMYSNLNERKENYLSPLVYYGGNYVFNAKHSLTLNGLFTHTLFDPTIKNEMTIQRSFFEVQKGNAGIKPNKIFNHTLTYNGSLGRSNIELAYNGYVYLQNTLHHYTTDATKVYEMIANDGTFYGNMFLLSFTQTAFKKRLKLTGTLIQEYNILRSATYNLVKPITRFKTAANYFIGDFFIALDYSLPYTILNSSNPYHMKKDASYGLLTRWNKNSWGISLLVRNVFNKFYATNSYMDYGVYDQNHWNYNQDLGRSIALTLTYNFGFGKKINKTQDQIETVINNAIMK